MSDMVRENFEKWHIERTKEEIKPVLIEALKNDRSEDTIKTLIDHGKFNEDELAEIYRVAGENYFRERLKSAEEVILELEETIKNYRNRYRK